MQFIRKHFEIQGLELWIKCIYKQFLFFKLLWNHHHWSINLFLYVILRKENHNIFTLRCLITISSPTTSLALVPYAFTPCIPLKREKIQNQHQRDAKYAFQKNNWIKFMQHFCFVCCSTFVIFAHFFNHFLLILYSADTQKSIILI